MEIVALAPGDEAALRDFLADFERAGESQIPAYFAGPDWPHAKIVETFARQARGEGLPAGWVPATTLFLVDGGRILGVANVRHRLTESLLRFGGHVGYSVRPSERRKGHATRLVQEVLSYAKTALRLRRVLLTCDRENVASARVIERCGGVLENESFHEPDGRWVRRYWIALEGRSSGPREEQGRPGSSAEFPLKP